MKFILLTTIFASTSLYGQKKIDTSKVFAHKYCYVDTFDTKNESVFTKIETPAQFKGGSDAFLKFLVSNIKPETILNGMKQNERFYSDSAIIRFIISKKGIISNLTVTETSKETLRQELFEVIKKSSCDWVPGNFSGRLVNGWFQMKLFYILDRRPKEISIKIGYDIIY